jgi:hypothetical protein
MSSDYNGKNSDNFQLSDSWECRRSICLCNGTRDKYGKDLIWQVNLKRCTIKHTAKVGRRASWRVGAKSLKAQVGAEVAGRPTLGYLHNHSQTDPQSKSA